MRQRTAGQTKTRAGPSRPYDMWASAQRAELNWRPIKIKIHWRYLRINSSTSVFIDSVIPDRKMINLLFPFLMYFILVV